VTLLTSPTRTGLLTEARHVVLPEGIASTGFPSVRETCRQIGIEFDPWQLELNRCILAKTADGLYAADTAVISIPRQVGKTFDIGAVVFALCIKTPGLTVVWTAHRFKVSRETFNELRGLAKSRKLTPHLEYDEITTAAGNECIPFKNGSRIVFAARERGAIRGFTKVGVLILDEAQILTAAVLADLAPTMNQATNPLIILMGTPPKPTDPGEVFTELRAQALGGDSEGVLYVEMSADPGSDPDDRAAWRKANPSFPGRTPERAILRLRKLLTEEDFLREALGIWDDPDNRVDCALDFQRWLTLIDPESQPTGRLFYGVAFTLDRSAAALAVCGHRGSRFHVDVGDHRPGVSWVPERCKELNLKHGPATFVVDSGGPAASVIGPLRDAGLDVMVGDLGDYRTACALMVDGIADRTLVHRGQDELNRAVQIAVWRTAGDGAPVFGRRASGEDITRLEAAAWAHWCAHRGSGFNIY
jgi:hypothetical protein